MTVDREALQESVNTMLFINDIIALSDTALADLLKKNCDANGRCELSVDGWDHLSKDERASLAERLL